MANFNEKTTEFYNGTNLPVLQLPKYRDGKEAAIRLIKEKDYISEADFWILMNTNKAKDKMLYSGLIISHNGCLKINDNLPDKDKFRPECVAVNENGYGGALVFSYCCPEQGIYEVGEVTAKNCKNEYPYAMALKRCFDRVVLKQCKLAFYGIYSDSEADEFKEPEHTSPTSTQKDVEKADKINANFAPDKTAMATPEQIKTIEEDCFALGWPLETVLTKNKIESLDRLTEKAAAKMIKMLETSVKQKGAA